MAYKKGGALPILPMLLGTLGASILTGRVLYRSGQRMYRAGSKGKGLYRTGQGIKKNHSCHHIL